MWGGNLNSLGYSVLVVVVVVVLAVEFRLFIMPKTMLGGVGWLLKGVGGGVS